MDNKKNQLKEYFQPLKDTLTDYNTILDSIENIEHVLIGEATHGSHEFYSIRVDITKRLILEKKFNAIAIEADWPDVHRINQYIKGDKTIKNATDAFGGFKKFPTWMWRNEVIIEFVEWLYSYNSKLPFVKKIGFYGLDLYSLNTSIEVIIKYLEKKDMEAANKARQRYACFNSLKDELSSYGYAATFGMTKSCENEVREQLLELNENSYKYMNENSIEEDQCYYITQNARLVKNAEKYYRSMFEHKSSSWNIRDTYMFETLDLLAEHLSKQLKSSAKIVTWAHNSHIGDARATELKALKQVNLGQLAREKYGNKVFIIGFLTYAGFVTSATKWGGVVEYKKILPALSHSYEYFLHNLSATNFIINFISMDIIDELIPAGLLQRAIGVIYLPKTERASHYFHTNLIKQFDTVIYIDKTSALRPLEITSTWHFGEQFETFPFGL